MSLYPRSFNALDTAYADPDASNAIFVSRGIHSKIIVCTTLDENGNVVKKNRFENSFENLEEYLSVFQKGDSFVMESTGFYEPLYDFIESHGFKVILANPLKIKLIAESRMKNDDVDSEVLAKLLKNGWVPE